MKNQFCSRMQNLNPTNIISFSRVNVNRKNQKRGSLRAENAAVTVSENGSVRRIKKALTAPLGGLVMSINFSCVFGFPRGRVKI